MYFLGFEKSSDWRRFATGVCIILSFCVKEAREQWRDFLTLSHKDHKARSLFLNKTADDWEMRSISNTKRFKPPIF